MKRVLTAEQTAARDARRARFQELSRKIAAMSDTERAKWQAEAGIVVTIEGHALSPRNTILCYFQRQGVTMVGGFRQWIKAGRAVMKGEHGISILVPVGVKHADGGEAEAESGEVHFIAGTVFDVTQTQEIETGAAVETTETVEALTR